MKKIKIIKGERAFLFFSLLFLTIFFLTACGQSGRIDQEKKVEDEYLSPYSEEEIVKIMEENLGTLVKVEADSPENGLKPENGANPENGTDTKNDAFMLNYEILGGKSPSIYRHEESRQNIYIYLFDSLKERKEANLDIRNLFAFTGHSYTVANNAIIGSVYMWEDQAGLEFAKELSDTVLKKLNPYQEAQYLGQSDKWTAQVDIGWYEYFAKDESGTLIYESWSSKRGRAFYRGEDEDFEVSYKLAFGPSSSQSGNTYLNGKELNFGSSSGSGSMGIKNLELVSLQLDWKGQSEAIDLLR